MYSIVTVLVVIGCIIFFVLKIDQPAKKSEKKISSEKMQTENQDSKKEENTSANAQEKPKNLVPDTLKDLFEIALNPTKFGKPVLYALITCHHCARMQRYLKEENVDFSIVHVDLFDAVPREEIMNKVKEYNPRGSFPTLVMPNGFTVSGFRITLLKEALENDTTATQRSV